MNLIIIIIIYCIMLPVTTPQPDFIHHAPDMLLNNRIRSRRGTTERSVRQLLLLIRELVFQSEPPTPQTPNELVFRLPKHVGVIPRSVALIFQRLASLPFESSVRVSK